MQGQRWKVSVSSIVLVVLMVLSSFLYSAESKRYQLNIMAENVEQALQALATSSGKQLLFPYDQMKPLKVMISISGRYTLNQALGIILKDTSLSGELTADGVILITPLLKKSEGIKMINSKKNILTSTIAFFMASGGQGVLAQGEGDELGWLLEEVVVTATKRETSLQDTALSISAIGSDTIDKRGLVGMDDYLRTLPGVNMQDLGAGQNMINIRSLSTGPQAEGVSVGAYFGEVPMTGFGMPSNTGGIGNLDMKLVDIERLEVLRGPQGTLYGSGSMGGTTRVIPNAPNLESMEGKLATSYSQTDKDGGDNTMVQAVINVPLIEDTLAVRAVAYQFKNSGYIKNVAASQPLDLTTRSVNQGAVVSDRGDVGNDEYTGYRLAALWQATEALDVTLSYAYQEIEQDGLPEIDLLLGEDYRQSRLKIGENFSQDEFAGYDVDIVSLVANYDFGWAQLSSASSWVDYASLLAVDHSILNFLGNIPVYTNNTDNIEQYTQEFRLSSQLEGPIQFLVGAYYEDVEDNFFNDLLNSGDPELNADGPVIRNIVDSSREQKAVFGELSYEISDQLSLTAGVRYFDYEIERASTFISGGVTLTDDLHVFADETGETYKLNLSYRPNEDTLIYGQWSEGFRMGAPLTPNPTCQAEPGFEEPTQVDADTTENFELGLKTAMFDNRVNVSLAVYQINWDGIPVFIPRSGCSIGGSISINAGTAEAEGIELEVAALLSEHWKLDMSASYSEGIFTEDAALFGAIAEDGDDLPGSADFNASLGLEYTFNWLGRDSFARLDYSYLSEYFHTIDRVDPPVGGYGLFHFKAGMTLDKVDIDLYVKNLTNENGLIWVESVAELFTGSRRAYQVRPRTVGLNLSYRF